jgi:NADP-dependent 3-hydroxy acid dehydrogenase YdfG
MPRTNEYAGKIVVITGASSGFGRGTAVELARRGVSVVLAARSETLLQEAANECRQAGAKAIAVPTDVSQREGVDQLARQALTEFGHFDVWINNAGVAAIGRFEQVPLDDHLQVVQTDLLGTIFGTYAAMQHFRQRARHGH